VSSVEALASHATEHETPDIKEKHMSTNALIHIVETNDTIDMPGTTYSIYKHWDGYPSGVQTMIEDALKIAWTLPRFEADEFAASFVAANKTASGDVRLVNPDDKVWFDFVYVIRHIEGSDKLAVTVGHSTGYDELDRVEFEMTWVGYHTRLGEAYAKKEDAA
jgi:hypothetical protein